MKTAIEVVLLAILVVLIMLSPAMCGAQVDEDVAVKTLETYGFTDVKVISKDVYFIGCKGGDGNDNVKFTATATNPAGDRVEVEVFAGWPWKDATVRVRK